MATAPLAQPARDVLRPLPRAASPLDWAVQFGHRYWHLTGVTDTLVCPAPTSHTTVVPAPVGQPTDPALLALVVQRLDDGFPGWRNGPNGEPRAANVVAWRSSADGGRDHLPTGRVDLLDFCSERWQPRIDSGRWLHAHFDGHLVDPEALDHYGRRGGIVVSVTDPQWRPATRTGGTSDPRSDSPVFEGPRNQWIAAARNCRTVLIQLGLAVGVECQVRGVDVDLATTEVITSLIDHLVSWWHPAFSCHVDVVASLADGLSNLRFTDPAHVATAPEVLDRVTTLVVAAGVQSAPVQFS